MADPLSELVEPAPVKFSFGAPGWYVAGALILLVLLFAGWLAYRFYRRNRYRREALRWLDERMLLLKEDYASAVYECNMLIKRIAMSKYGRTAVADKRGEEWIVQLNRTGRTDAFSRTELDLLNNGVYSGKSISQTEAMLFIEKTKKWIRQNRAKI
ncbi:MAG TPA: DUF4381 domain-containing protein [Puia sp.]|nr:DUF4381 domain-containing protein [Puia sp.]